MLYAAFALLTGRTHKFDLQTVQNNGTGENEIGPVKIYAQIYLQAPAE